MRRPVGVKWSFLSFRGTRFFSRRVANVATLPSALFVSDFRSVQVGCSRFSRCCHLIIDLPFHPENGSWARRLTQSPELGAWAFSYPECFYYAATGRARRLLLRNGSYTSPLTHKRCSKTANFRAVAIMARFFPFLPPRWASFRPQLRRSLSAPNGPRMCCAPCTSSVRK